jgi:membrane-associated protease RseP (regulator of RpoE activity)
LDRPDFETDWFPGKAYHPEPQFYKPPSYFNLEKKNILVAILLLGITFLTCVLAGYGWDVDFRLAATGQTDFPTELLMHPSVVLRGVPFAVAVMFILLCHELGHFIACRLYRLHSTPPIPIPFPSFPGFIQTFGTLGAFIKIKAPFRNRKELFDVGVMGPLCGMAAAIPIFLAGVRLSTTSVFPPQGEVLYFGDSLLMQWGLKLFLPDVPSDAIVLHPLGWAAWFGFLATSLNLLPISQLDGGHTVYALFGPRGHRFISLACFAGLILLTVWSWPTPGYLVFAVILFFLKLTHPPTLDDGPGIGRGRKMLAILILVIFILTFIPVPVRIEYY